MRGSTTRLRAPCTVVGATRRWTSFVLAVDAPPPVAILAGALEAPVAEVIASDAGTTTVFWTSDGWRAELVIGVDERSGPVDHDLLEALVRRKILTGRQRVALAAKLRARAHVRRAWLAAHGFEILMGFMI